MKTYHLLFCVLVLVIAFPDLNAQKKKKNKTFKTHIISLDNKLIGKGYLGELQTSSITLYTKQDIMSGGAPSVDLKIEEIKKMKFESKGGFLSGFVLGAAIGVAAGLASGDDEDCLVGEYLCFKYTAEGRAVRWGLLTGLAGGVIGTVISSKKILIGGNQQSYDQKKAEMYKYLY